MTPKFEEGRSAKACILKSGFSSQSGGRVAGRFEDFCEGLGDGPGEDGEKELLDEEVDGVRSGLEEESALFAVLLESVETNRW